jgi:hypothetical protein
MYPPAEKLRKEWESKSGGAAQPHISGLGTAKVYSAGDARMMSAAPTFSHKQKPDFLKNT